MSKSSLQMKEGTKLVAGVGHLTGTSFSSFYFHLSGFTTEIVNEIFPLERNVV